MSVWFILGTVVVLPSNLRRSDRNVVVLNMWASHTKPERNEFLRELNATIADASKSFSVEMGQASYAFHLSINNVLADLPAKAIICNCKQWNGKFGCSLCLHPGEILENSRSTRIYRYRDTFPPRTTENVKEHAKVATKTGKSLFGVKGKGLLSNIIDIPSQVPIDYMHCVLEGVAKRFVNELTSPTNRREKFSVRDSILVLNREILATQVPHNMHRKPRSFDVQCRWKGAEWRTFIFYLVPLLRGYLNDEYFAHFMLLVTAIRFICDAPVNFANVQLAKSMMQNYVKQVESLYGARNCTYNVHALTHLCDHVLQFGPLPNTSAFVFESAIGVLNSHAHGSRSVPEQVGRNIALDFNLREHLLINPELGIKMPFIKSIIREQTQQKHNTQHIDGVNFILPFKSSTVSESLRSSIIEVAHELLLSKEYLRHLHTFQLANRIIVHQTIYHSTSYNRRGKSCSFLVEWGENNFGKILYFFTLNNIALALVEQFHTNGMNACNGILCNDASLEQFINLNQLGAQFRSITNDYPDTKVIRCNQIKHRCIFVPNNTDCSVVGYISKEVNYVNEHD